MRVVVAPDKFKGSLTAVEVARAIADGLRGARPDVTTTLLPVADGGDGTVAAAVAAGFEGHTVEVEGPTGDVVRAPYARRAERAVVELAAACGLELLPGGRLAPMRSSTYGLGQVIAAAVADGATEVVVGVGGSASTDGGAGMIQALGGRLLDADGAEIGRGGGALARVRELELTQLRSRLAGVRIQVASDVDNPLLGPAGAAAVFGPQKGADAAQLAELEHGLTTWSDLVTRTVGHDDADTPGAGAAGGTAFGAVALLGATLRSGIDLVLEMLDFGTQLSGADLAITGEGSLDNQSLAGKAPIGVASAARAAGVRTVAVAGRCLLTRDQWESAGLEAVYPLTDLEPDPARSIADAASLLRTVGGRIAAEQLGP